jgi:hypothetical protein
MSAPDAPLTGDALLVAVTDAMVALHKRYRVLDVEQVGQVYEGLLDHTAVRITDTALGMSGKEEPELALGEGEA